MRVLCIDKKPPVREHPALLAAYNDIVIGEEYNVVDEEVYKDKLWYELAEFPHPLVIVFEAECFVLLSEIDEVEIAQAREPKYKIYIDGQLVGTTNQIIHLSKIRRL